MYRLSILIIARRRSMISMILMMFSHVSTKHCECFVSESSSDEMPQQSADFLLALAAAYLMFREAHSDTILRLPRTDNPDVVEEVPVKKGTNVVMDFVGIGISCFSSLRLLIQSLQATILKHSRIRNPSSLGGGRRLRPKMANPPPTLERLAKYPRPTQQQH